MQPRQDVYSRQCEAIKRRYSDARPHQSISNAQTNDDGGHVDGVNNKKHKVADRQDVCAKIHAWPMPSRQTGELPCLDTEDD
jgi:hypothetical protein